MTWITLNPTTCPDSGVSGRYPYTGWFGKPRPAEVLFERICRKNGIKQLLTKPYSPTTIGKVERWHQTLQTDFLTDAGPFATIDDAQAAVDAWRHEYNHDRPHQSLGMATPASRFRLRAPEPDEALSLWAPADLELLTSPPPAPDHAVAAAEPASWPDAVEVDRVVPPSGNMTVGPQQFWLGTTRAGQKVTVWIDTATCHLSVGGWRIKTVPSRLTEVDLARLRGSDGRPAGPPPAGPSPGALASSRCVEVDRLVNGTGGVTLGNRLILVGSPLAGQRARIRLDGQLMHVITQDGVLWRTLPCPIPPGQRHRLQGVRLAGPAPLPGPGGGPATEPERTISPVRAGQQGAPGAWYCSLGATELPDTVSDKINWAFAGRDWGLIMYRNPGSAPGFPER